MQAFFKQHFAGTTAQYRIIDEVDWGVAGNIMGRPVVTQHLDMLQASPAWWADLASAWLMMGWYVHDILQSKWDNVILEQVCSNGAGVLLGGPQGYVE